MAKLMTLFKRVLVVICVLVLATGAFFIGRATVSAGSMAADYAAAAGFIKKGDPTFCSLSEQARLFACPTARVYMTSPSGGGIIIYQCDKEAQGGYLELIDTTNEEGEEVLRKVVRSGMQYTGHCIENGSTVYRLHQAAGGPDVFPRSI